MRIAGVVLIWPEMLDADLDHPLGGNVVPCFLVKGPSKKSRDALSKVCTTDGDSKGLTASDEVRMKVLVF